MDEINETKKSSFIVVRLYALLFAIWSFIFSVMVLVSSGTELLDILYAVFLFIYSLIICVFCFRRGAISAINIQLYFGINFAVGAILAALPDYKGLVWQQGWMFWLFVNCSVVGCVLGFLEVWFRKKYRCGIKRTIYATLPLIASAIASFIYLEEGTIISNCIAAVSTAICAVKVVFPIRAGVYRKCQNDDETLQNKIRRDKLSILLPIGLLLYGVDLISEFFIFSGADYSEQVFMLLVGAITIVASVFYFIIRKQSYSNYIKSQSEENGKTRDGTAGESDKLQENNSENGIYGGKVSTNFIESDFPIELLVNDFKKFSSDCGVSISDETIREFFSLLLTNKPLIISGSQRKEAELFIKTVKAYFGQETKNYANQNEIANLGIADGTNQGTSTEKHLLPEIANLIKFASDNPKNLFFIEITKDVLTEQPIGQLFTVNDSDKLVLHYNQYVGGQKLSYERTVILPDNARVVFTCADNEEVYQNLAKLPFTLNVLLVEVKSDFVQIPARKDGILSTEKLEMLTENVLDDNFLQEADWRKFDGFEKVLKAETGFNLDNRMALDMEKFVAVYLALGGSTEQAIDILLSSMLLPAVFSKGIDTIRNNYNVLVSSLDEEFGLTNIKTTKLFIDHANVTREFVSNMEGV